MSSRRNLCMSCLLIALIGALASVGAPAPKRGPKDSPLGMKFVPLTKGTFYMGGGGGKAGKKTEIKEDFEIAIHTVTQGQWQEVMGKYGIKIPDGKKREGRPQRPPGKEDVMVNRPSFFSRLGFGKDYVKDIKDEDLNQFPAEMVLWEEAQEFIKKLNEKEKGRGYLYRLPSEAEWEYACRGGATSEEECSYHFYFDKPTNDLSSKQANFNGAAPFGKADKGPCLARTTKVGSYAPNKLGLYDMHGNVWQWCQDLFDPKNARLRVRVCRGGSYPDDAGDCRAAARHLYYPTNCHSSILGFRLARVPVR